MTEAQREQVDQFFGDLCELTPGEQASILATIDDPEVRAEVASLLSHTAPTTKGLNTSIGELMQAATEQGAFEDRAIGPGTRFERYRIERRIGQGGMGDVYEAVRENDFHKRVALKIVRYGLDSDFARSRFQQERQTLAGLEHPYIARLLDGGEAANGCPYLVLEFVDGASIDQYCETRSRDAILALFLKVCEAVEYAHRNLIIHRDLKPGNILVTADGTPKLLDFGIAKLLDANATVTQTMSIALTPQYASPEQVRGQSITTASDVYSLGVILYQLLTGRKPYAVETTTAFELERVVCQEPPEPPGIGNELDDILMMALRKEPERRYASVLEFAQDIERFREGRPVLAAPDSTAYRARKYIRRHWIGLAATSAIVLAVAVGAAISLYQARIAKQRFDQVRSLAHSFVFDYSDDLAKIQGTTAVREKMVTTALTYLDNLSKSAGNDLSLQKELAVSYQMVGNAQGFPTLPNLGHTDAAVASYRKAAEIGERIAMRDPSYRGDLGVFYASFAQLKLRTGDFDDARKTADLAVHNLEEANVKSSSTKTLGNLAHAWCVLGDIDEDVGHTDDAFQRYTRCDALSREVLARGRNAQSLRLAQDAKERLGTANMEVGHLHDALAIFDQDQALIVEILKLEPANPRAKRNLALLGQYRSEVWYDDRYPNFDNPAESVKYAQQYLDTTRAIVARDENDHSARFSMAVALFRLSYPMGHVRPAEAVSLARESVSVFDSLIAGGDKSYLVTSRRNRGSRRLAEGLLANGQIKEAANQAEETLRTQRGLVAQHPDDLDERTILAMILTVRAQIAVAQADRAVAIGYLTEADQLATSVYNRGTTELQIIQPLSKIRALLAAQYAATGDQAKARYWNDAALKLWTALPDQNEYVRRQSALLIQGAKGVAD